MKAELDKMVTSQIIAPVTEPTDWVSKLVFSSVLAVPKKDGSVRICLDLQLSVLIIPYLLWMMLRLELPRQKYSA